MTFAEMVKTARAERGLSQEEVAKLCNIAQVTVHESGRYFPHPNTAAVLARVLRLDYADMMQAVKESKKNLKED